MHSRAHLLLKKELATFERLPLPGVSVAPVSSYDLYKWSARLEGPEDTVWKGGVFQLNITFTDEYNAVPPAVNFMTIPFHPNVHPDTGEPVCKLLTDDVWNENHDLRSLLHEIQNLLTNPEDSDPGMVVNHEAAYMYKHQPHTYKQMVMDCVTASLKIEAGISPYGHSLSVSRSHSDPSVNGSLILLPQIPSSSKQSTKRMRQISFDDYHLFWKDLATSVPGSTTKRKHQPTALKLFDPKKRSVKSEQSVRDDVESRMTNHYTLKYGISRESRNTDKQQHDKTNDKEYRQKRIAKLMEMYTKDNNSSATEVCGDDEADDLVKWTKSLNISDLTSTS